MAIWSVLRFWTDFFNCAKKNYFHLCLIVFNFDLSLSFASCPLVQSFVICSFSGGQGTKVLIFLSAPGGGQEGGKGSPQTLSGHLFLKNHNLKRKKIKGNKLGKLLLKVFVSARCFHVSAFVGGIKKKTFSDFGICINNCFILSFLSKLFQVFLV
jgi:hypothetical protein